MLDGAADGALVDVQAAGQFGDGADAAGLKDLQ